MGTSARPGRVDTGEARAAHVMRGPRTSATDQGGARRRKRRRPEVYAVLAKNRQTIRPSLCSPSPLPNAVSLIYGWLLDGTLADAVGAQDGAGSPLHAPGALQHQHPSVPQGERIGSNH